MQTLLAQSITSDLPSLPFKCRWLFEPVDKEYFKDSAALVYNFSVGQSEAAGFSARWRGVAAVSGVRCSNAPAAVAKMCISIACYYQVAGCYGRPPAAWLHISSTFLHSLYRLLQQPRAPCYSRRYNNNSLVCRV